MCKKSDVCARTSGGSQSARQRSWTPEDRSADQRGRSYQSNPADGSRSANTPAQELRRANGHRLRPQPTHLWDSITQHPSANTAGLVNQTCYLSNGLVMTAHNLTFSVFRLSCVSVAGVKTASIGTLNRARAPMAVTVPSAPDQSETSKMLQADMVSVRFFFISSFSIIMFALPVFKWVELILGFCWFFNVSAWMFLCF